VRDVADAGTNRARGLRCLRVMFGYGSLISARSYVPSALFARARSRGIKLAFSDLLPCPFNLFGRRSWFDLFLGIEKQKPDLEPWRNVFEQIAKWAGVTGDNQGSQQ
jgi:hypothetical protein